MIFKKNKEDVKIGIENVPDSVDFKFFDQLKNQNSSVMSGVQELKKSIDKLRRIAKFKIIIGGAVVTFIITTYLAATTEYEEIILNLLGGIF
ncbi:MAG TPA: hypothetical protein VMX17_08625 [Candidatus Glassbacteria bacterium]|nr:hypothetical protein [Candidatus Glassbacteria bacterium]